MKIRTAGALVAAMTVLAGCQTTGMDNAALIGAATQVAAASAAPAPASYAPASSLAQDPVAIAAVQQQAARQGMTLTPEQAATAIAMQQSGASGASLQNAALQQAAINGGAALAGQQIAQAAMTTTTATTTTTTDATASALAPAGTPDGQKSCEQLSAEIAQQQQVIAEAGSTSTNAQIVDAGLGIAQSVGMHFGGFGLGGIQATGAASSVANQQKQAAEQQVQQAEIRVQVLSGIYQGKGC